MVYTDGTLLVADTIDELHNFAQSIGMERSWFKQDPEYPYYEVWGYKLEQAMEKGAIKQTSKHCLLLSLQMSETGQNSPNILLMQIDKLLEYDGYYPASLPRQLIVKLMEKLTNLAVDTNIKSPIK